MFLQKAAKPEPAKHEPLAKPSREIKVGDKIAFYRGKELLSGTVKSIVDRVASMKVGHDIVKCPVDQIKEAAAK